MSRKSVFAALLLVALLVGHSAPAQAQQFALGHYGIKVNGPDGQGYNGWLMVWTDGDYEGIWYFENGNRKEQWLYTPGGPGYPAIAVTVGMFDKRWTVTMPSDPGANTKVPRYAVFYLPEYLPGSPQYK